MTVLSKDTKRDQLGGPSVPVLSRLSFPMEANTQVFGGGLFAVNAAGNAIRPQTSGALRIPGVVAAGVDNTTANNPGFGTAGAKTAECVCGVFPFADDGTFTAGAVYQSAYAVDDNTLSANDGGGARPYAGYSIQNDGGQIRFVIGKANPYAGAGEGQPATTPFVARGVITTLGVNTGTGTGKLTITAAGALGTQDGITTLANGDVVFIPAGTTNLAAASDAGFYVLGNVAGVTTGPTFTRPAGWYEKGMPIPLRPTEIQEGTLYIGASIKSFAAKGTIIDTDDPQLFARKITQQLTMGSNVITVANVAIRSATKSQVFATMAALGGTMTGVTNFEPLVITPGALNTASVTITPTGTAMATMTPGATPVCNVTILN